MNKLFRFFNALVKSKVLKRPVFLSHLLTQKCNLDCGYCLWKDNAATSMTTEEIINVHSDAAKNGFIGSFLWGGEPLLRNDIEKILCHDRSLGWLITLATNGCFLEQKAGIIARCVDNLLVSIDLPSEEHDTIRKGKAFAAAVQGIRAVKRENKKCNITLCSVLSKYNKDHLRDLAQFARKEGCQWIIQHMDLKPGTTSTLDLSQEERDKAIDELVLLKKEGFPLTNSFAYLRQFRSKPLGYGCRAQYLYLTIWPDGEVKSCVIGKHIANVLEVPIKKLLKLPAYRKHLLASKACSRCRDAGTLESTYIYNLKLRPAINFLRKAHF